MTDSTALEKLREVGRPNFIDIPVKDFTTTDAHELVLAFDALASRLAEAERPKTLDLLDAQGHVLLRQVLTIGDFKWISTYGPLEVMEVSVRGA